MYLSISWGHTKVSLQPSTLECSCDDDANGLAGTIARDEPLPPQPPPVIGDPGPPLFAKPRLPWGYADAVSKDFDADHFSTGGERAALVKDVIRSMVKNYQPDLMLCLLGINDFIWAQESPEGLLAIMKTIVDESRAANPRLKFAIGNVIRRSLLEPDLDGRTEKYNPLLEAAIPGWSTERSPIYHVDVASAYSCGSQWPHCPAAFDGLHPSTLGSYQIAKAFAQSLIDDYGIGSKSLRIPVALPVNRIYSAPKNLEAEGSPVGVKVTWNHIYGMTSYKVKWRSEGQNWTEQHVTTNRMDSITSTPGIVFQYQVRACHGERCSRYSEVVTGTSNRDTAPPPTNIGIESLAGAFRINWSPPEDSHRWNITQYEISLRNAAESTFTAVGSRRQSEKITGFLGLPKGSIWFVRMATWTDPEGAGFYEYARPVMVGGEKPESPSNLKARYTSHTSALLTWNVSANAAGYQVYWRDINGRFMTDGVIGLEPRKQLQNLAHGRGEYEFCVSSVNGEVESKPACLTPGASSIDRYPADWLRLLPMYSTVWFCTLLLVAVLLTRSRKNREPPPILGGIELAEDRISKIFGAFAR